MADRGEKRLDRIGTRDVEKLKADLLDRGRAEKTINNVLAVLSKMIVYAVHAKVLDKKINIQFKKLSEQEMDFLDFDEYGLLLDVLDSEKV